MMLVLLRGVRWFGSGVRRQNFFELNPIYPDQGQKDFDIYNIEYKHVQGGRLAVAD
jgi:small subunit ribosomal protein S9